MRLVHSVVVTIMANNQLLKSFIANALKYGLKIKFKYVCITLCTLLMSPFSHDFLQMQLRYLQCFNRGNYYLKYSHSACF